ncbi:MAG: type II toxin-antitoxin system VapC family toxin [bacterium]|nr:type II toxin-antitoxin system VapC family toxin [bacterium]
MNRIFVDTLFVVALVNRRDQYHEYASELAEKYDDHPLLTTDSVLLEIGNALARNFKIQAVDIIDQFKSSEEIKIIGSSPLLFEKGFELYRTHKDKTWGLVDCLSFIVMREANIDSALTFDQHFVQAGFKALMRNKP